MANPHHLLGQRAEAATAAWLTSCGWQVIERRWRDAGGELDLVCLDVHGVLVGVEVKCRRSGRAGAPIEAIDSARIRRLRATLAAYQGMRLVGRTALRIDLVTAVPVPGRSAWRLTRLPAIDAW